jgi:ABC-type uncharacterized transport system
MSSAETHAPSFLDPLVAQRRQVAIGLAAVGAILAAISIWWGIWGFARSGDRAAAKSDGKVVLEDIGKAEPTPEEAKPTHSADYQVACIWAAGMALLALLSSGWLYTQPVDPTAPLTSARTEVVAFGGTIGLLIALFGAVLGYRWYHSAVVWIGSKDATEAKWVLYAAAVFLAGLLVMFASLQLARVEERSNAMLRRVLYGFNSVFMGLLLLLVLVVINVFVFIKVPGTLATNESAFTGLSEESKRFLHSLDRPVHVYLILPESYSVPLGRGLSYDTMYPDCRGLLTACEGESPKFQASFLSPAFDADRIAALFQRLNVERPNEKDYGVLVTVGDTEDAHTFIREMELISAEQGQLVFQAESRLMTELAYLTDTRGKEKVYFTQGHGELLIEAGGEAGEKAMTGIVQYLRDRKFTVEALPLDAPGAKVPDDAAVVVVAGLRRFVGPEDPMFVALRDFVRRPDKPGKLFACLPAFRDVQGKVSATGLEPLLAELGVELDSGARIMSAPGQYRVPADYVLVAPVAGLEPDLSRIVRGAELFLRDTRPVRPVQAPPGGPKRVNFLMATDMVTWQESDYNLSPAQLIAAMNADPQLRQQKKVSSRPVPVAAAVVDSVGEKGAKRPRALVFGADTFLQDQTPVPAGPEEFRQLLVSDGIDWLRERSASTGITPRKVGVFTVEKPIDWTSQLVLMAMVSVGIAVLGIGVWLSRRR